VSAFAGDVVRFRISWRQGLRLQPKPWWMPDRVRWHLIHRIARLAVLEVEGKLVAADIGRLDRWSLRHLIVVLLEANDPRVERVG
jgi:hypothetical protein